MKKQTDKPEKMEAVRDDAACAIQSIIDVYKDKVFKFYGRDSLNLMCHVTFLPNKVERLRDDVAILKGNIEYEGEVMKGVIKVDLKKKHVFYAPPRGDWQDPLLVDNRTKKVWDAFLSELKSVHDRIIASAKDAASTMKNATELRLQALTDSIFSKVSREITLLFWEFNPQDNQGYPVDFHLEKAYMATEKLIVFHGNVKVSFRDPKNGYIGYFFEDNAFYRGHITSSKNFKCDMALKVDINSPENVALLNKLTTHISNFMKEKDKEHNS